MTDTYYNGHSAHIPYFTNYHGHNSNKRTIKYLAVSKDPKINTGIIKRAPKVVIKTNCNAAENVLRGNLHLTPEQKRVFKKHKKVILELRTRKIPIDKKRDLIIQDGGAFWIPLLVSAALSALGSLLFKKPD